MMWKLVKNSRLGAIGLKLDDDVLNIPLFMADQVDRLIGLALENKRVFILLDFPSYLIYYTCKKVTHE